METGIVLREHFPEWKLELSYVSIFSMGSVTGRSFCDWSVIL